MATGSDDNSPICANEYILDRYNKLAMEIGRKEISKSGLTRALKNLFKAGLIDKPNKDEYQVTYEIIRLNLTDAIVLKILSSGNPDALTKKGNE